MGSIKLGWRRFCGVIVLMAACVFMLAWTRSEFVEDSLWLNLPNASTFVESHRGTVSVTVTIETQTMGSLNDFYVEWNSTPIQPMTLSLEWGSRMHIPSQIEMEWVDIWYGWIAIPLTLLATGLVLVPPRSQRQTRNAQSGSVSDATIDP